MRNLRLAAFGALVFSVFGCGSRETKESAPDAAVEPIAEQAFVGPNVTLTRTRDGYRVNARRNLDAASTQHVAAVRLPLSADGVFDVGSRGITLHARVLGMQAVPGRVVGDHVRYEAAGTTLVHAPSASGTEESLVFAAPPAEHVIRYEVSFEGVRGLRLAGGVLEALDAGGDPKLRVTRPIAIGANGAQRVGTLDVEGCAVDRSELVPWGRPVVSPASDHCTVVARWSDEGLTYPVTVDPAWTATGSLAAARNSHVAAMVQEPSGACVSGCVVVVGGNGTGAATPEVYNVGTKSFTTAPLPAAVTFNGRTGIASVGAGIWAVFAGGIDASLAQTASIVAWSQSHGWNKLPDMTQTFAGGTFIAMGTTGAILAGGDHGGTRFTNTYSFNLAAVPPSYAADKPLSTPRSYGFGAYYLQVTPSPPPDPPTSEAHLCVFGGGAGTDTSADCRIIDYSFGKLGAWSTTAGVTSNQVATMAQIGAKVVVRDDTGNIDLFDMSSFTATKAVATSSAWAGEVGAAAGSATALDRAVFTGGGKYNLLCDCNYPVNNVDYLLLPSTRTTAKMVDARQLHTATTLPDGRVLVVGGQATDASGADASNSAEIFAPESAGSGCTVNGECASGLTCVEGVCCDISKAATAGCLGQCESCVVPGKVGTCAPRPAGSQPVTGRTACATPAGGTCGFQCDGVDAVANRNACHAPDVTVACSTASCSSGTFVGVGHCSGGGNCNVPAPAGCSPYTCNAAGNACQTTCTSNTDCSAGNKCNGTNCVPTGAAGSACNPTHVPSDCASGLSCVDGVCCSSASCPSGQKCNVSGAEGSCKLPLGSACTTGTASSCGSGHCSDGVCCNMACDGQCEHCDASGSCNAVAAFNPPVGTRPACGGTGECQATCDGTTRSACGPKPGNTKVCSKQSCTGTALTGLGYCDGLGGCSLPAPSSCIPYTCASASACGLSCTSSTDCATGYACNAGKCVTTGQLGTVCDDASQCKSGHCAPSTTPGTSVCCSVDACATGTFCGDTTSSSPGSCIKKIGSTCSDPNECATGFCVDGVCCDSACGGQCESCIAPGATGRCSAVSGAPLGTKKACDDGGTEVCLARTCDGTDRTKCVGYVNGGSKECSRACADGATVAVGVCDGAGMCGTPKQTSCGGYACDKGACKTSCATQADCSTGYYCDSATHACTPAVGKCSDDRTQSTDAKGGQTKNCAPYYCDPGSGGCATTCASSSDCQNGLVCDSTQQCVEGAAPDTGSSGGCAMGSTQSSSALGLFSLSAVAMLAIARRRAEKR